MRSKSKFWTILTRSVRIVFFAIMVSLFQACSVEDVSNSTDNQELKQFFKSETFKNFQDHFNGESNNLNVSLSGIVHQEAKANVVVFSIPVNKNGKMQGKLYVFSKDKGQKYEALFESHKKFNPETGGMIKLYTAKGNRVVDFVAKKTDNNQFSLRINNVNTPKLYVSKLKSARTSDEDGGDGDGDGGGGDGGGGDGGGGDGGGGDGGDGDGGDGGDGDDDDDDDDDDEDPPFPDKNDGWLTCTADCYAFLKKGCGSDPKCDLACDLLNLGAFSCTISIFAACGLYCI
jgi:uncharacterized membrane protein YgcG